MFRDEPDNTVSTMETSESLGEVIVRTARKCQGRLAASKGQGHTAASRKQRKSVSIFY